MQLQSRDLPLWCRRCNTTRRGRHSPTRSPGRFHRDISRSRSSAVSFDCNCCCMLADRASKLQQDRRIIYAQAARKLQLVHRKLQLVHKSCAYLVCCVTTSHSQGALHVEVQVQVQMLRGSEAKQMKTTVAYTQPTTQQGQPMTMAYTTRLNSTAR